MLCTSYTTCRHTVYLQKKCTVINLKVYGRFEQNVSVTIFRNTIVREKLLCFSCVIELIIGFIK